MEAVIVELTAFGEHSDYKCHVEKTICIPLGRAKHNINLLNHISDLKKHSPDFVQNKFTVLGINFANSMSIPEIMEVNYEARITKAKSWVSIWNRRDLTLMGKVTIIKSLIYSQFSYLAIPLIKPSNSLIKSIDTLTFNFLWGCKRDKVKRELIKGTISEGGLGLFDFSEFLISLKLTLIKKLIDQKFTHKWKKVFVSQLKFPTNIEISIEKGLASERFRIVSDILSCYREWKVRVVTARDWCMNHVVWANNKITDIGSRIWNKKLISRDILHISDFINNDNSLMSIS